MNCFSPAGFPAPAACVALSVVAHESRCAAMPPRQCAPLTQTGTLRFCPGDAHSAWNNLFGERFDSGAPGGSARDEAPLIGASRIARQPLENEMENSRTIPEVAADIMRQASSLLRTEVNLARAEMSENLEAISGGLRMLIVGATLVIPGLVLLLEAFAAAVIAAGLAAYWSLAIFGGGALILGIVLTSIGRRRMKFSQLKPQRTLDELNRDMAMAKEQMGMDDDATRRAA